MLYHKFIFNPWEDTVDIDTPVKGMPEDCIQGYAYPIDGGWRFTDIDHKPINDPYIKTKLLLALDGEESEPAQTILPDRIGTCG